MQRGRVFEALAQVFGRTAFPFLRKYVVPAAKRIGAGMLEFAAPEIGEVISCWKSFKTAAKSVGKQTLKKQLGSGSKQRRIIPTKSAKQSSRSRRDNFTNLSPWSCQTTYLGTKLLWQCMEILEEESQLLTMSFPRVNKKFILLPHLMKTAYSLNFKRIGTIKFIWDSLFWHWSSNLSKDVDTIHTRVRKKRAQRRVCCFHKNRNRQRRRSSSSYLCKQHIATDIFKCWSVY